MEKYDEMSISTFCESWKIELMDKFLILYLNKINEIMFVSKKKMSNFNKYDMTIFFCSSCFYDEYIIQINEKKVV